MAGVVLAVLDQFGAILFLKKHERPVLRAPPPLGPVDPAATRNRLSADPFVLIDNLPRPRWQVAPESDNYFSNLGPLIRIRVKTLVMVRMDNTVEQNSAFR